MAVIDDYPAKLTTGYYRVRESWEDTASQVGAFRILANAIAKCDDNPGTYVFDNDGNAIYPEEETEEETGVEEESGVEEDADTGEEDSGTEDTDDAAEATEDTDGAADDAVEAAEDTDEAADDAVETEEDTEEATDNAAEIADETEDTVDTDEEEAADADTNSDGSDEADESDDSADEETADDTDEDFPAAEQDPVAYGRLKTLMNIRVEPSLEAEILTTYAKGTIVSILEILDTGWLKIICDAADDGYAYVSNEEGEYAYVGTSLYTVKSGDTLWKIAQEQLGSGTLYKEIRTLNGLTSNTIKVGMQLILP